MDGCERDTRLDSGGRNWLIKTAKQNLWRVANWYELDDLIEDGLLCWQIVLAKYPQVVARPHLMRLFQTTYRNHLHQLANKRTQTTETCMAILPDLLPDPDAELLLRVQEAPQPLRACLLALLARPQAAGQCRRYAGGQRQTTDSWLKGLANVISDVNVAEQLREFLKP
jgi:hypothetical protein